MNEGMTWDLTKVDVYSSSLIAVNERTDVWIGLDKCRHLRLLSSLNSLSFPLCFSSFSAFFLSSLHSLQQSGLPLSVVRIFSQSSALPGGELFRLQFTAPCLEPFSDTG